MLWWRGFILQQKKPLEVMDLPNLEVTRCFEYFPETSTDFVSLKVLY